MDTKKPTSVDGRCETGPRGLLSPAPSPPCRRIPTKPLVPRRGLVGGWTPCGPACGRPCLGESAVLCRPQVVFPAAPVCVSRSWSLKLQKPVELSSLCPPLQYPKTHVSCLLFLVGPQVPQLPCLGHGWPWGPSQSWRPPSAHGLMTRSHGRAGGGAGTLEPGGLGCDSRLKHRVTSRSLFPPL